MILELLTLYARPLGSPFAYESVKGLLVFSKAHMWSTAPCRICAFFRQGSKHQRPFPGPKNQDNCLGIRVGCGHAAKGYSSIGLLS